MLLTHLIKAFYSKIASFPRVGLNRSKFLETTTSLFSPQAIFPDKIQGPLGRCDLLHHLETTSVVQLLCLHQSTHLIHPPQTVTCPPSPKKGHFFKKKLVGLPTTIFFIDMSVFFGGGGVVSIGNASILFTNTQDDRIQAPTTQNALTFSSAISSKRVVSGST